MKLYEHQQKIIAEDPKKAGLFLGTGSGKTRVALSLARGKTMVICPKTQKEDQNWEREYDKMGKPDFITELFVISKETFRRDHATLPAFDTIIIDEAHTCLGVAPATRQRKKVIIPRASQLFESIESFLERTKPKRFYLVTATPIRSPMTVWATAKLLGRKLDFFAFRQMFYFKLPVGYDVWSPKKDEASKKKISNIVKKLGFIGRLQDYFDVPDQVYRTVYVDLTEKQKKRIEEMKFEYPEPIARVGKIHQIENGSLKGDKFSDPEFFDNQKVEKLCDFAAEFPQMIVFVKYRQQMMQIYDALYKDYKVFIMDGDTKDRGELIKEVNATEKYIFIVQASISSGWEVLNCPVVVFASMDYSIVHRTQGEGRVLRSENIRSNLYITLVTKGYVDEAVHKCIKNKQSFDEELFAKKT